MSLNWPQNTQRGLLNSLMNSHVIRAVLLTVSISFPKAICPVAEFIFPSAIVFLFGLKKMIIEIVISKKRRVKTVLPLSSRLRPHVKVFLIYDKFNSSYIISSHALKNLLLLLKSFSNETKSR